LAEEIPVKIIEAPVDFMARVSSAGPIDIIDPAPVNTSPPMVLEPIPLQSLTVALSNSSATSIIGRTLADVISETIVEARTLAIRKLQLS
jgi:hypothetical protein